MKLKRSTNQIRDKYLEGQEIRQEEAKEPLLIPIIPFMLTLLSGSIIGYFSGLAFHQRPSSGIITGLAAAFIIFIVVQLERKKSIRRRQSH